MLPPGEGHTEERKGGGERGVGGGGERGVGGGGERGVGLGRHVYKLVYLLYREISAKASIVHVTVAFNVPPNCTESS